MPFILHALDETSGEALQDIADALKGSFDGVLFLAATLKGTVSLLATVSSAFTGKVAAGKLIQTAAPAVDGKGGGRPDAARGAGKNPAGIPTALSSVRHLLVTSA
jgi:alanyl-tRNA synthetase